MRRIIALLLLLASQGCAVYYVQNMETHKEKLILTAMKETRLLWWPLWLRQTVQACTFTEPNQITCQEAVVDYGNNPL
jgi:hypothetical protein